MTVTRSLLVLVPGLLASAAAAASAATRPSAAASDPTAFAAVAAPMSAHAPSVYAAARSSGAAAHHAPAAAAADAVPAAASGGARPPGVPDSVPVEAVSGLLIPVQGVKAADLVDTFTHARSEGRVHDAIDIMAPRGTPVLAAHDGTVVKLFDSKRGGLTVYEFDPTRQVVYYYAHLDRYAPGLVEGQTLHRGDVLGFVGSTGDANADAPHLHFELQILGPEKQWWRATSINPYVPLGGLAK
ncbi:MAG TPA: M23 family metallopeptidase [Dokdonella sp.]